LALLFNKLDQARITRLQAAHVGRNCFELQLFLRHVLFVSQVLSGNKIVKEKYVCLAMD